MLYILFSASLTAFIALTSQILNSGLEEEKAILACLWIQEVEAASALKCSSKTERGLYDDELAQKLVERGMVLSTSYLQSGFHYRITKQGEVPFEAWESLDFSRCLERLVHSGKITVKWVEGTEKRYYRLYCELTEAGRESLKRICQADRLVALG